MRFIVRQNGYHWLHASDNPEDEDSRFRVNWPQYTTPVAGYVRILGKDEFLAEIMNNETLNISGVRGNK